MKEEINKALDEIFAGYIDTPDLRDFREELFMNLTERVEESVAGGCSQQDALGRALEELGDVTEAADAVSRKKRNEFIGQTYMPKKVPLDKAHAIGYPLMGIILLFGIITGISRGIASDSLGNFFMLSLPFVVAAAGVLTYLGVTQETQQRYGMAKKRGAAYGFAAALLSFGICVTGSFLFREVPFAGLTPGGLAGAKFELIAENPNSIIVMIPFVLPALAIFGFLALTEKDNRKPWVIHQEQQATQQFGERFGYLSGALWTFAIALFILLGLVVSWRISWVVFLFAIAAQCLLLYFMAQKE